MFSPVFLDVSFIARNETDVLSDFVPLHFGRLSAFFLGPGGVGILAESPTVSLFLSRQRHEGCISFPFLFKQNPPKNRSRKSSCVSHAVLMFWW